jgi:PAS domain S-box-containing protein
LNRYFPGEKCLGLCQYDLRLFSPEALLGVLTTHPKVFLGHELCHNFYYHPEETHEGGVSPQALLEHRMATLGRYREMEEELRRREEYYKSLVENAYEAITVLKADGTRIYASPSIERLTGYRPEELLGRTPFELMHPDDLPQVMETFSEGLREPGSVKRAEYRFRHKDGTWRTFESVGRNLLEDPAVRGIVINYHDITERRRAERAVQEARQFAESIVETVREPLVVLDADLRIISANRAFHRTFRVLPEEAEGRRIYELDEHQWNIPRLR